MKYYICECGKAFTSSQKFNGHKGHCKVHLAAVGKLDAYADRMARASATGRKAHLEQQAARKQQNLLTWIDAQHKCEHCGKIMTEKFGSGRFCSRACAMARKHSPETKEKIKQSVINTYNAHKNDAVVKKSSIDTIERIEAYLKNPKHCAICGKVLSYEQRFRKTCSEKCYHLALSNGGKTSANKTVKRSYNETAFCTLCEQHFGCEDVLHNKPLFNGWDADIILVKEKVAILWNGPWHYHKITAQHHLEQVQNRDRIKVAEIEKSGFTPYIIKDLSKANDEKVRTEFKKLLAYLETRHVNK